MVVLALLLLLLLRVLAALAVVPPRATAVPLPPTVGLVVTRPGAQALPMVARVQLGRAALVAVVPVPGELRTVGLAAVPLEQALPLVRRVVQVRAVALVVETPARLVAVRAGRPRPVLAQALLVQEMPRVTGAAVPVVMLRVQPRPVVPPRVAPGRAVPLPAVTAVPVVLPMPVLVQPVRVAQVRQVPAVARPAALAVPAVLRIAVPVAMLPVVPVRLVRPAPVVRVRAVRVVTPTLPAVPVRAGRVVTAPARVGIPLRVGSPRLVARRRPARLLAPLVVTPRRTAGMLPGRPGTRPLRRVTVRLVGRVVTPGRVVLVPSVVRAALVATAVPVVPRPRVAVVRVLPTTPASTPVQRLRRRV